MDVALTMLFLLSVEEKSKILTDWHLGDKHFKNIFSCTINPKYVVQKQTCKTNNEVKDVLQKRNI